MGQLKRAIYVVGDFRIYEITCHDKPVFIADGIENCFNTVGGSDLGGEIKGVLNELLAAVTEAAKVADEATAGKMLEALLSVGYPG